MNENQVKLLQNIKYNFCRIEDKKYLVVKKNKKTIYYIYIPKEISLTKPNKEFFNINFTEDNLLAANIFKRFLINLTTLFKFPARKVLLFKGLGLKFDYLGLSRSLELKLGYSHRNIVKVDKTIKVFTKKGIIFAKSVNKVKLGNFMYKIKKLKMPDHYRGKGIWYKDEKIKLKVIKKK